MSFTKGELRILKERVRNTKINITKDEAHQFLTRMGMFDEKGKLKEPYKSYAKQPVPSVQPK